MSHGQKLVILMLGGGRRVSMAEQLKESGRRLGCDIHIIGYELQTEVPLAAVGHIERGLPWTNPNAIDDVVRVAREWKVDIILPFANGAVSLASRCKPHLNGVFIPVCDPETAHILFDKIAAAKAFKEANMPIPRTYSILNAELPAIAKPRHGSASRGIKVFHNMDDLMHLDNIKDYLIQAYIPEFDEYTVDCYVSRSGEILCMVPRIRLEIMGGEVTRTRTCREPEIEEMTRRVLEALHLRGPVTVQFMHDLQNDRRLLLEVNPRLGGGVICSIKAGAPIADYIIREALDVEVSPCYDWCDNTLMTRYWKEVIFYDH